MVENTLERLIGYYMMLERMWEHPHHSADIGGHQSGCMALISKSVEIEPSSFVEEVKQPMWFDAMVEEYDCIIRNSVWDVVPRLVDKLVVSSVWL